MGNLTDYSDFFIFITGLVIASGIIYFLFLSKLKNIFISDRETARLVNSKQVVTPKIYLPKISLTVVLLIVIVGLFLFNQFLMWRMGSDGVLGNLFSISINISRKK